MKRVKRTQMECFEGASVRELRDDFNRKMGWVARHSALHDKPVLDLTTLTGYVIYEENADIPENLRDAFDLHNIMLHCGECKHYVHGSYGFGDCPYVRYGKGVQGLRKNDEVCDRFYAAWEQQGDCWLKGGDSEYRYIVDEFKCPNIRAREVEEDMRRKEDSNA